MFRYIAWALFALFLMVVGLWPAAATPIELLGDGAAVILALIPGPVLALAAAVAWLRLKHRPTPTATA
jgi:hypothetical protein